MPGGVGRDTERPMGSVRPFLEGSLKQPWLKALAAFSLKQPAGKEEADFRPTLFDRHFFYEIARSSASLPRSHSLIHSLSTKDHPPRGLDPPPLPGSPPLSPSLSILSAVSIDRGEQEEKEEEEEEEDPPRYTPPLCPERILGPPSGLRNTFFRKMDTSHSGTREQRTE